MIWYSISYFGTFLFRLCVAHWTFFDHVGCSNVFFSFTPSTDPGTKRDTLKLHSDGSKFCRERLGRRMAGSVWSLVTPNYSQVRHSSFSNSLQHFVSISQNLNSPTETLTLATNYDIPKISWIIRLDGNNVTGETMVDKIK